MYSESMCTNQD